MRHGHLLVDSVQLTGIDVLQTATAVERMRGLLWREPLTDEQLLWITRCNSVHTFFMCYAIDVVFVNRKGVVCKVCADVKPWSFAGSVSANASIEMRAGTAEKMGIARGMTLQFSPGVNK